MNKYIWIRQKSFPNFDNEYVVGITISPKALRYRTMSEKRAKIALSFIENPHIELDGGIMSVFGFKKESESDVR